MIVMITGAFMFGYFHSSTITILIITRIRNLVVAPKGTIELNSPRNFSPILSEKLPSETSPGIIWTVQGFSLYVCCLVCKGNGFVKRKLRSIYTYVYICVNVSRGGFLVIVLTWKKILNSACHIKEKSRENRSKYLKACGERRKLCYVQLTLHKLKEFTRWKPDI
jgi:hypothetical protein